MHLLNKNAICYALLKLFDIASNLGPRYRRRSTVYFYPQMDSEGEIHRSHTGVYTGLDAGCGQT